MIFGTGSDLSILKPSIQSNHNPDGMSRTSRVKEQWVTIYNSTHHKRHWPESQPTRTQVQHVRSLKTRPLYALFELFKSLACVSKIISPNSNYWQTSPMGNQRWRRQSVVQLARIFTFEFTPLTKEGKTY